MKESELPSNQTYTQVADTTLLSLNIMRSASLWLPQAVGVGWGEKTKDDVELDPPSMRQAIGWSFAMRNIRRMEAGEAEQALLKSTGAESVRDVKVRTR